MPKKLVPALTPNSSKAILISLNTVVKQQHQRTAEKNLGEYTWFERYLF